MAYPISPPAVAPLLLWLLNSEKRQRGVTSPQDGTSYPLLELADVEDADAPLIVSERYSNYNCYARMQAWEKISHLDVEEAGTSPSDEYSASSNEDKQLVEVPFPTV